MRCNSWQTGRKGAVNRMPVLFVGHGSPMNLVMENEYTQSLANLSAAIERPVAVCIISAHWMTRGTKVCCASTPRQIYDFYGFPEKLYRIHYTPPGAPELSRRVIDLMGGEREGVACDDTWGDDHAGWAVLKHLYPNADVPICLISVDMTAPEGRHVELARRLAPLRDEGVLILASGNIVHNLYEADFQNTDALPDRRGVRFDSRIKAALEVGDLAPLISYGSLGSDAQFAVPTRDHFLPLLWAAALRRPEDTATFPCEIFQNRSVSMRSVLLGALP